MCRSSKNKCLGLPDRLYSLSVEYFAITVLRWLHLWGIWSYEAQCCLEYRWMQSIYLRISFCHSSFWLIAENWVLSSAGVFPDHIEKSNATNLVNADLVPVVEWRAECSSSSISFRSKTNRLYHSKTRVPIAALSHYSLLKLKPFSNGFLKFQEKFDIDMLFDLHRNQECDKTVTHLNQSSKTNRTLLFDGWSFNPLVAVFFDFVVDCSFRRR